jgi:hypothetical protein
MIKQKKDIKTGRAINTEGREIYKKERKENNERMEGNRRNKLKQ